jgi:hypothetical protein
VGVVAAQAPQGSLGRLGLQPAGQLAQRGALYRRRRHGQLVGFGGEEDEVQPEGGRGSLQS